MDKEDAVHIYAVEYYAATKKDGRMPFAAMWINLEKIISVKSDREQQIVYITTYMQNLKRK